MNKRRILFIISILMGILLLDTAFGLGMDYLSSKAKGGDTFNNHYINKCLNDSIVVFGSSRANHHYDTSILEEEFGITAYNAGIDGNGIILAYAFLNNILARGEKPHIVIYDLLPDFDLYDNADRQAALNKIRPYYNASGMKEIIDDIDDKEYFKLHLASYRYNSIFIQIISDAISPRQTVVKGYKPLDGSITDKFISNEDDASRPVDPVKVKYLRRFIGLCEKENIKCVFVTSPYYHKVKDTQLYRRLLKEHSSKHDLLYLNFINDSSFTGQDSLFVDPSHMNRLGAGKFTRLLIDSLKAKNIVGPVD